ncbi:BTAD domain-containing putative transcriptional regulator [Phytohabitans sp. LJ34]|uniref:AfsR/SARP family transcriptional regulator n=1 Tax=Phytohabitans sp. LJ34 TaxID=3452217 RepID=UPI003F8B8DE4
MSGDSNLTIRLLGPLDVSMGGHTVPLTSARLRTLLAVLALAPGRPVSVDRLATAIWDEDLPANARRAVQLYVTRLRGALGADRIRTEPAGYALMIEPEQVDAVRFGQLLDAAATVPDTTVERARLGEALALWRGAPFEGARSAWLESVDAPGLVERHLTAVERRAELELAQGRHEELIPQLSRLTAQHPTRERLCALLMQALFRAGRRSDALNAYQRLRQVLDDELGLEPEPALRELHRRILTEDSALAEPVDSRLADGPVPRQMPPGVADFAGRSEALDRLDALLPDTGTPEPAAVVISAVIGTAGVGKTALALHWAHRVANRFPDGQLYVNLRGFDHSGRFMDAGEAVRGFLHALGVPPQRIPPGLEAQAAMFRSLVAGKRILILLDNARDAEQVRPLLPGAPGSLVVVTSRSQLSGLVAAKAAVPVTIDLLTYTEARQLLSTRLGAGRVAAEPEAVDDIVNRCAQLPLALAIVAARAATYPEFPLSALAAELREPAGRLDALANVREVFSWSYRTLSPQAARLFRLLGLHPGPDTSAAGAASLAALPPRLTRGLLAELTGAHLLFEHHPGRYTFHDLLRAYAADLAAETDPEAERQAAVLRVLDHYLHTAYTAARLLYSARDPIDLAPAQPGVVPESLDSVEQAMEWFVAEHTVLLAAVDRAVAAELDTHTWQLAWTLTDFLDRNGYGHDWAAVAGAAVAAAERSASIGAQARAHRFFARALYQLRRLDDTNRHMRLALALCERDGDPVGQAHTHHALASLLGRQGERTAALEHVKTALRLYTEVGHRHGQAAALNAIGWYRAQLGEPQQALVDCQRSLALLEELGDYAGAADVWDSIGFAQHQLGRYAEAIACFERSAQMHEEIGDRRFAAENLVHKGDAHHAAGEHDAAHEAWRRALPILEELDHPDAQLVRANLKLRADQP